MMFQWTDGEVSHVVKLAVESMRSAALGRTADHRHRLVGALASELSASSWHAHTVAIDEAELRPWRSIAADLEHDWSEFNPFDFYTTSLRRMFDAVQASSCTIEEVVHRSSHLPGCGEHYVLAWLAVQPHGTCACVEFLKRLGDGPFTLRDEAVLRIFSTELLAESSGGAAGPSLLDVADVAELPRRQREVLAQLLAGSSVKEIASELGISPYTVNDYIKALYRRYQVSSRGELMAAVHGFRRPVAAAQAIRGDGNSRTVQSH